MEVVEIVKCRVMKGLGPEWTDKIFEIHLDDVEPGTPEYIIKEMVRAEARRQLKGAGYLRFTIEDIEKT